MTSAEAAVLLHRAADHLLERYYETTNTPERAEEAMDIGSVVGLLFALAQRLDGQPFGSGTGLRVVGEEGGIPAESREPLFGAQGRTRTGTDFSTRPSNVRVYQFRHLGFQKSRGSFGPAGLRMTLRVTSSQERARALPAPSGRS